LEKHALKSLKTLPAKLSAFAPAPESQSTSGFCIQASPSTHPVTFMKYEFLVRFQKKLLKTLETLYSLREMPSKTLRVSGEQEG